MLHRSSPSLRGHMRMASYVPGELIPCAFVWHELGITPCCKSPKLPGDKILAIRRTNRRPPIYAASVTLPSSPARSSSGNEVPHIFTRKSRLQPGEFLVTSAKRLLQQYRHQADTPRRLLFCPLSAAERTLQMRAGLRNTRPWAETTCATTAP